MALLRKRIKDPVSGTAQVVSASGFGDGNAVYASCRMNLVVQAEGIPAYDVEHRQLCPTKKWPFPGSVVPVIVSKADPHRLRIEFDDLQGTADRARQQAEHQAALLRGETGASVETPGATSVQWIGGGPEDLSAEQRRKVADLLGMSLDGTGSTAVSGEDDRIAQLERLAKLKEAGALSDEEFTAEKRRILDN